MSLHRQVIPRGPFQSTLPMRGETSLDTTALQTIGHFNPLSPCGERHESAFAEYTTRPISIHSPHAGRDERGVTVKYQNSDFNPLSPCGERRKVVLLLLYYKDFNPLSPCGERRTALKRLMMAPLAFQSTLPMRGETYDQIKVFTSGFDFNPLSPCGERRSHCPGGRWQDGFQSTLPMRGETTGDLVSLRLLEISIHSPHAGRDGMVLT